MEEAPGAEPAPDRTREISEQDLCSWLETQQGQPKLGKENDCQEVAGYDSKFQQADAGNQAARAIHRLALQRRQQRSSRPQSSCKSQHCMPISEQQAGDGSSKAGRPMTGRGSTMAGLVQRFREAPPLPREKRCASPKPLAVAGTEPIFAEKVQPAFWWRQETNAGAQSSSGKFLFSVSSRLDTTAAMHQLQMDDIQPISACRSQNLSPLALPDGHPPAVDDDLGSSYRSPAALPLIAACMPPVHLQQSSKSSCSSDDECELEACLNQAHAVLQQSTTHASLHDCQGPRLDRLFQPLQAINVKPWERLTHSQPSRPGQQPGQLRQDHCCSRICASTSQSSTDGEMQLLQHQISTDCGQLVVHLEAGQHSFSCEQPPLMSWTPTEAGSWSPRLKLTVPDACGVSAPLHGNNFEQLGIELPAPDPESVNDILARVLRAQGLDMPCSPGDVEAEEGDSAQCNQHELDLASPADGDSILEAILARLGLHTMQHCSADALPGIDTWQARSAESADG
ncbi:hypothetical protein WJX74_003414 [Apatococcus lobatus]|uniref:Uncharacterized protein n=1 Tax=Apatococcus lobatus TaxID=904363 RepID=A0AAW1R301_9CHLO